jgi:flagellar hook-basal body complex protein FliE
MTGNTPDLPPNCTLCWAHAFNRIDPIHSYRHKTMELKLTPVSLQTPIRPATGAKAAATGGAGAVGVGGGFSGALQNALSSVSAAQNESTRLQNEVQMENPQVSLEETMVAIQKAQIGFTATLNVRNRMVQAYTDIMNMQV